MSTTRYRWHDGFEFTAADASQAIAKLRAEARLPEASFDEYKAGLAFRASEYVGVKLRGDTPEALLEDCLKHGLVEVIG